MIALLLLLATAVLANGQFDVCPGIGASKWRIPLCDSDSPCEARYRDQGTDAWSSYNPSHWCQPCRCADGYACDDRAIRSCRDKRLEGTVSEGTGYFTRKWYRYEDACHFCERMDLWKVMMRFH